MADVLLSIRLGIPDNVRNKGVFSKLRKWLNQAGIKPSYEDLANDFVTNIFNSVQLSTKSFATVEISHNTKDYLLIDLAHPRLENTGKWVLDAQPLSNGATIFVKLENLWIKGKVKFRGDGCSIIIEPEDVEMPLSEKLFLRW